MLKMSVTSGDTEEIMELADTPEFVLLQFCDLILRRQDLRNPDARYMLRETVNALKIQATREEPAGPASADRYALKQHISQIEDVLKQFDAEDVNQESGDDAH